jgi:hypothetical protein
LKTLQRKVNYSKIEDLKSKYNYNNFEIDLTNYFSAIYIVSDKVLFDIKLTMLWKCCGKKEQESPNIYL